MPARFLCCHTHKKRRPCRPACVLAAHNPAGLDRALCDLSRQGGCEASGPPPVSARRTEAASAATTRTHTHSLTLTITHLHKQTRPKVRAEINELITQLEARCPRLPDDDARAAAALDGVWTLAYTANSELTPLLALGRLPGCAVGPITQTIGGGTATNAVPLSGPLASTTLEASAAVEVRSPKRLALRFERGRVAPLSPGLGAGLDLPARLSVGGADLDLGPLKAALAPAAGAAASAAAALASAAAGLPPLDFSIPTALGPLPLPSETWLLTTFLDDSLRIARGDGGSVFVMTRDPPSAAAREVEMEAMMEDE